MHLRTFLTLALTLILPHALFAESDAKAEALLKSENLGGLKVGLPADGVVKLLGKPTKQGKLIKQEADGTWVQEWSYPASGLKVTVTSGEKKDGAKTVASFSATSGCKLATAKGISVGSPESALRKAYGSFESKADSNAEMFVAGSMYGGILFWIEKGKVSRIFFGAAAE